jgi:hypothetical protein
MSEFWTSPQLEPKKSYQYTVAFENIGSFLIKGATLPAVEIGTIEADYTQYKFYYPGKMSWSPVEFTIYDVAGPQSVAKKLQSILGKVGVKMPVNSNDQATMSKMGFADKLGDIKITQLGTGGASDPQGTWTLVNPIITSVNYGTQGYSEESLIEVTVGVQYDWANYEAGA